MSTYLSLLESMLMSAVQVNHHFKISGCKKTNTELNDAETPPASLLTMNNLSYVDLTVEGFNKLKIS